MLRNGNPDTQIPDPAFCAQALLSHLEEIENSPAFKGSVRSQQFLRYVVEVAIGGHPERLKERSLGVELFGRPASYNTGEDAIVRVTASDVRRRLHHFYSENASDLRIVLPAGSYKPEFHSTGALPPPPAQAATPAGNGRGPDAVRRAALYALAGIAIFMGSWLGSRSIVQEKANLGELLPWSAIFAGDRQTQLILSDPDIAAIQRLLGFHISLSDYANGLYWPDERPLAPELQGILRGVHVPLVDVKIALRLAKLAPSEARLQTHPARSLRLANFNTDGNFILLGSPWSNPWTGLFREQTDFEFVYDTSLGTEVIRNRRVQPGERPLYVPTAKGWQTGQVFATLALVRNPGRSGRVLLLAGTNAEGTEAAGMLAANRELLKAGLKRFDIDPAGPACSFELLIEVRAMAGSAGSFEVIAGHRLRDAEATANQ